MSINATSNYMSNADILAWMETKTEGLYGQMRDAMDVANTRADAESALDDIKAAIANAKSNGGDADAVHKAIDDALLKYKDIPEVAQVLQPMADKLDTAYANAQSCADWNKQELAALLAKPVGSDIFSQLARKAQIQQFTDGSVVKPVKISSDDADAWTKQIGDKVDALGKQDQLGLINIQEFNSQLNQAKQTASALMESADKSANSIINHIS